jgi:hypothetical protein
MTLKEFYKSEKNWKKDGGFFNEEGEEVHENVGCTCGCLFIAAKVCYPDLYPNIMKRIIDHLQLTVVGIGYNALFDWNDHQDRTFQDILDVVDAVEPVFLKDMNLFEEAKNDLATT